MYSGLIAKGIEYTKIETQKERTEMEPKLCEDIKDQKFPKFSERHQFSDSKPLWTQAGEIHR